MAFASMVYAFQLRTPDTGKVAKLLRIDTLGTEMLTRTILTFFKSCDVVLGIDRLNYFLITKWSKKETCECLRQSTRWQLPNKEPPMRRTKWDRLIV